MESYEVVKEWVQSLDVTSGSPRDQLRLVRDRSESAFPEAISELIEGFDFDAEEAELAAWFRRLIKAEPPRGRRGGLYDLFRRQPLAGLWFGVFDTSDGAASDQIYPSFYVAGSEIVDPDDEYCEWAVSPEWWPNGRYADSVFLKSLVDADSDVQELLSAVYVACLAIRLCGSSIRELCGNSEWFAIGSGHDSGDAYLLAWIDPTGVHGRDWRPRPESVG